MLDDERWKEESPEPGGRDMGMGPTGPERAPDDPAETRKGSDMAGAVEADPAPAELPSSPDRTAPSDRVPS